MMQPDRQRLEHIRDYCAAIEKTVERYGREYEVYAADADYQRSIAFSLFQIGELSGGLSEAFRRETAEYIPWGPIKAMRNIVVHNYGHIDHAMVWETMTEDIPKLLRFCGEQLT